MSVFLIASISVDGFISPTGLDLEGPSTYWTSREDTEFFKAKTKEAGVVIMGRTTWESIPEKYRPLKDRLNIIYTSQPETIQDSSPLTEFINLKSNIINRTITTNLRPQKVIELITANGKKHIAICGGTSIYTQFLQEGVVDELFLTIEPVVFGTGTPLFDKQLDTKLHLVSIIELSKNTQVLHYKVE
jgi:dihydrofolate reductase